MAIRIDKYYEENKDLTLKEIMEKIIELEKWLSSDNRKEFEASQMSKPLLERIDADNSIEISTSELKVLRKIVKEKIVILNEKFKFSDEKNVINYVKKEDFDNFMSKVNKYNEQVANGQIPDVKMEDLLDEYTDIFNDKSL